MGMKLVSVPSRGLRYLNNKKWCLYFMVLVSVPSRGLRYLNKPAEVSHFEWASFRPLTGIKVSEQLILNGKWNNENMVSVPSRGLRYLNNEYTALVIEKALVSVPSRGLRYLNKTSLVHWQLNERRFRPLTGIKVSEQQQVSALLKAGYSFRPLTGIKVSELLFSDLFNFFI